jgi:hypothetical protein
MNNMDRVIFGSILLIGLGLGLNAQACTTDGWASDSGNIPPNAVAGSPTLISRYSELCALEVSDTSYVQHTASDTRYIGRFYAYPNTGGAGTVDILIAYSDQVTTDATTDLFTISYDGADFTFDATEAGGGMASTAASSGWNLVEFEYNADSGNFNYWVNVAWDFDALSYTAPTGTFASGAGTVEAVQLGAPNGMGGLTGEITFDAYEAHRTTSVGALVVGDANGNLSVNIFDMIGIQNEILDPVTKLAAGQPDCNENGSVNIFDMICVQNIILAGN